MCTQRLDQLESLLLFRASLKSMVLKVDYRIQLKTKYLFANSPKMGPEYTWGFIPKEETTDFYKPMHNSYLAKIQ